MLFVCKLPVFKAILIYQQEDNQLFRKCLFGVHFEIFTREYFPVFRYYFSKITLKLLTKFNNHELFYTFNP